MAARAGRDRAAAFIRARILDGTFQPGDPIPSGTEVAGLAGCCAATARKAMTALAADGTLTRLPSRRYRVPRPAPGRDDPGPEFSHVSGPVSSPWLAVQTLAAALRYRRLIAGLAIGELADRAGSVLSVVSDAEAARPWQPREFWERMDAVLDTGGELVGLHDLYRAAIGPRETPGLCHSCPYQEDEPNPSRTAPS